MCWRLALCIFGSGFGGSPCATALVRQLDCVSVLLEPPRGLSCPPSSSCGTPSDTLAHFNASHSTASAPAAAKLLQMDRKKGEKTLTKNECDRFDINSTDRFFSVNDFVQLNNYRAVIFENEKVVR